MIRAIGLLSGGLDSTKKTLAEDAEIQVIDNDGETTFLLSEYISFKNVEMNGCL